MSVEDLHHYANADTPSAVYVPNNPWGLAAWALGRFGVSIVAAAVALYAANMFYTDMKAGNAQMLEVYKSQVQMIQSNTLAMEKLVTAVEKMSKDAETAHRFPR